MYIHSFGLKASGPFDEWIRLQPVSITGQQDFTQREFYYTLSCTSNVGFSVFIKKGYGAQAANGKSIRGFAAWNEADFGVKCVPLWEVYPL